MLRCDVVTMKNLLISAFCLCKPDTISARNAQHALLLVHMYDTEPFLYSHFLGGHWFLRCENCLSPFHPLSVSRLHSRTYVITVVEGPSWIIAEPPGEWDDRRCKQSCEAWWW